MSIETRYDLASWTRVPREAHVQHLIALSRRPGVLSLGGGLPDARLFPTEELGACTQQVLEDDPGALQYGPPFEPLRERIVEVVARRGIECSVDDVFITSGAQQALDVAARLFVDNGGEVIVDRAFYTGASQAFAPMEARLLGVDIDPRDGTEVEQIQEHLDAGAQPGVIYAMPAAHNPCAVRLSSARKARLLEIAARARVPIIEDDAYGLLWHDEPPGPSLYSTDPENVIYVGSLSKVVAPALRLGWMLLPPRLRAAAAVAKEAGDLESSALTQRVAAAYLGSGHFDGHLERVRAAYRERREAMLEALEEHFPESAKFERPPAGMFVWVELEEGIETMPLLERAVDEAKVAYVPGPVFAADETAARSAMRLSFSTCTTDEVREAVKRLGGLLRSL